MTFIGDTASGQEFAEKQAPKASQNGNVKTRTPRPSTSEERMKAFLDALPALMRRAERTEHKGKPTTPWTQDEITAAKNRLHSLFFNGQERDELPNAEHEESVRFGFGLSVRFKKLQGTPGQQAEWYPETKKAVDEFEARQRERREAAAKPRATRTTSTGEKLAAVS